MNYTSMLLKGQKIIFEKQKKKKKMYLLCVQERTGTRESAAISKNVSVIFMILFLI